MMNNLDTDIKENDIISEYPGILDILLKDRTTNKNIIWATNNYSRKGKGYAATDSISIEAISGYSGRVIKPRINKGKVEQKKRSRDMAEVFTPAWICNKQNNMIDNEWFGYEESFNEEVFEGWESTKKVEFVTKKWNEYVEEERIEITCGEAPYLTSRYDVVKGNYIEPHDRIGLLDRKLRVISENVDDKNEWFKYAEIAFKRTYGYDFQGDNVLIARENLLLDFIDFYNDKFNEKPSIKNIEKIAKIISWNVFQMDGIKNVIPLSCHEEVDMQIGLLPDFEKKPEHCLGCKSGDIKKHNGIYCKIKDWKENKTIRFVDLIN